MALYLLVESIHEKYCQQFGMIGDSFFSHFVPSRIKHCYRQLILNQYIYVSQIQQSEPLNILLFDPFFPFISEYWKIGIISYQNPSLDTYEIVFPLEK